MLLDQWNLMDQDAKVKAFRPASETVAVYLC